MSTYTLYGTNNAGAWQDTADIDADATDFISGADYLVDYLNGPYYGQAEANGNGWTLTAGTNTTLAGAVAV